MKGRWRWRWRVLDPEVGCQGLRLARKTGLEPATTGSTGRDSNQLSYFPSESQTSTTGLVSEVFLLVPRGLI